MSPQADRDAAVAAANALRYPKADYCDKGGSFLGMRDLEYEVPAPTGVPFTLAFRGKFPANNRYGGEPTVLVGWTIAKDTPPKNGSGAFQMGEPWQVPRIALSRQNNILMYEEVGCKAAGDLENGFLDVEDTVFDDSWHNIVLVRNESKIALFVDGRSQNMKFGQRGVKFDSADLPFKSCTAAPVTGKATSTNPYLKQNWRAIFGNAADVPNFGGEGVVQNLHFWKKGLHPSQFPHLDKGCFADLVSGQNSTSAQSSVTESPTSAQSSVNTALLES